MRWAALLRSVNAGKSLAMADLRAFLEAQGMTDASTVLASGNAIFSSPQHDAATLEKALHKTARETLALDTEWYLRSHAELARVTAANPFPDVATARPAQLQVFFHHAPIDPASLAALNEVNRGAERLYTSGRELFVDYPDGIGRSKLPQAMARAKFPRGTGRNWNTVMKLVELTG